MKRHLKSYAAPKSWTILKKIQKFILRPNPGAHPLEITMPIGLLLRQLECGKTSKEIKNILNDKNVIVDGKIIKDPHYGIGFMDTISIKPNTNLRCSINNKGKLTFINIPESELNKKICKITGKTSAKNGKVQLNLSDGRNILIEKNQYATGDSLLLETPSQKIIENIQLAKDSTVFLTGGKHVGFIGTVEDIKNNKVWCTKDKEKRETLKKFALVIGKEKPAIKL